MSNAISGFLTGAIFGVFFAAYAQSSLDDSHIKAGGFEHRGVLYRIAPAEPRS